MKKFFGRESYLDKLDALWRKSTSSFVVVAGRRRIGKSTLVEEFAARSNCEFIEIVGLPPGEKMTNQKQIDNFCERLARHIGRPRQSADCWARAFDALDDALKGRGRTIVFLDEISWMGKYDDSFAGFLKTAWDTQFSKHDRLIFIIAGSVSAWINRNIQRSKGYVGRISLDFTLPELPPATCLGFWGRKLDRTSTGDILDVLAVTGGVPKYLNEIDPSLSPDENIRRLCYDPDGYLFKDFDRIFDDVFGASISAKKRILTLLAEKPASVSELALALGGDPNGHLSENLAELQEAGFIAGARGRNPVTGKDVREIRYRLRDNYTRFYLRYILPKKESIANGFYQYVPLERLPGWDVIMGLQFENLVLNNIAVLAPHIGLMGKTVESAAPYFRSGRKTGKGVQIDYLVQLPKCTYVIEIKRKRHITSAIEDQMQEKLDRLKLPRGRSVKLVLVYAGELDPVVEENGFFDYLVPADRLLGR
ncbi:MAG: AAA family ATPase [Kiritimatiellae bacterium]|nr:AAA family ATPase [Kiritimatiellia bacterium]